MSDTGMGVATATATTAKVAPRTAFCSFCGLARDEVEVMVPAPLSAAFICDGCVGICFDVVVEKGGNPLKGMQTETSKAAAPVQKWGDRPDQYTDRIHAAHPVVTKDHATYAQALEMVGNRHGKYELVNLVNWLLKGQP